ncbi:hypothetical protein GWI33_007913 [Rhynchophorus ferrugineus]|uniref:Gustatory receptor n=1 Tax=Rhynchophorus ferrugineus TaxID=354439 RepID=A0A834MGA4_RHYFE|nr:hypothetical protein GWI33_007913 [Rhynchophorus ferrugineus]
MSPSKRVVPVKVLPLQEKNGASHRYDDVKNGLFARMLNNNRCAMKVLLAFFVALNLFGYSYAIYGKISHIIPDNLSGVLTFTDYIANALITLGNFISCRALYSYDSFEKELRNTSEKCPIESSKSRSNFTKLLQISFIVFFAFIVIDFYISFITLGPVIFSIYATKTLQCVMFAIVLTVVLGYADIVRLKFADINIELQRFSKECFEGKLILDNEKSICSNKIRLLTVYHGRICDLLDTFNDMFGTLIFFAIITIISNILWSLTVLIHFAVFGTRFGEVNISSWILMTTASSILITLGEAAFEAYIGEAIIQETKKSSVRCYYLLGKLQFGETDTDEDIKVCILTLIRQINVRNPSIKAGGFFVINFRVLGFILSQVSTYSIVATQFLLESRSK